MAVEIRVQDTPNPNAKKYIINGPVKTEGKISYNQQEECYNNILAHDLLGIAHIKSVHFFSNVITATQDGEGDWDHLDWLLKAIIETRFPIHNPDFKEKPDEIIRPKKENPELEKIEEILDRTIRPGLQMDGGDIEVIDIESNIISIHYLGACGGCPSASLGTLEAIRGILKNEYNPEVEVRIV